MKSKVLALTITLSIILGLMLALAVPVSADTPAWNVTGTWNINVNLSGTNYPETLVLTQTGTSITGVSLNSVPPAFSSAFTITGGSVTGDTITFQASYDSSPSDIDTFTGSIAINGSMSGTWADNPGFMGRSGTWASTSGQAIPETAAWNVSGTWGINVNLSGTNYPETLVLTQTGADISGVSLNSVPPLSSSAFTITSGIVAGNTVVFQATYNSNSSDYDTFAGTIASDGSMSGTWVDGPGFLGRSGTWASTSGQAAAVGGGTTGVNGTLAGVITLTQPGTVNFGAMALGVNDITTSMNIVSNDPWTVSVAGTAPNSAGSVDGYMTKYSLLPAPNGTYIPTVKLQNPLNIVASGGYLTPPSDPTETAPSNQNVTLTGTPQILATGIPQGQAPNGGETRTVDFIQNITGNDPALASGYSYHIVVSFTATAGY